MRNFLLKLLRWLVGWLWIFIMGILVGAWLGFNAARLYPALSLPAKMSLGGAVAPAEVRASNGVSLKITEAVRTGNALTLTLFVHNTGAGPVAIQLRHFSLLDQAGRTYALDLQGSIWGDETAQTQQRQTLNPGLTIPLHLAFDVAPGAKGLQLMYENVVMPVPN